MATRPIKITGSSTTTQKLILDYPKLKAHSGDTIRWIVHPNSGVDSIEVIKEKSGYNDIWSTKPQHNNHWTGVIKAGVPCDYDYEYEITWKKDDHFYKHDPKITVNPSGFSPFKLLIAIVSIILGFFSWQLLRRKMNEK